MATPSANSSGLGQSRNDLPPDQEQVAKTLTDMDGELAAMRVAFDQFFLGVERHNPIKECQDFRKRLLKLKGMFLRNTAVKFRVQSLYQKFQSYERLWLKTLKEIEEGTYRRDILRLRRKNEQRKLVEKAHAGAADDAADAAAPGGDRPGNSDEPPPRKGVFNLDLDDLEADLPSELFEEALSSARKAAPPRPPASPAASRDSMNPAPAAAVPSRASPAVAPSASAARPPAPPVAPPARPAVALPVAPPASSIAAPPSPPSPPSAAFGAKPAIAGRPPPPPPPAAFGGASAPGPSRPPPPPVPGASRPPPQPPGAVTRSSVPRTSTGSFPIAVDSAISAASRSSDPGVSPEKLQQIYSAYVTARRRCNESTSGITIEAVRKSLSNQVPQLLKEPGVKEVDFKVVIKDGKAVLKAVPK